VTAFTAEEMSAVRDRYPHLQIRKHGVAEGVLDLHAIYNGEERRDAFDVHIIAPPDYPNSMPSLVETGGRTAAIARKHGVNDLRDLHRNPGTGTACLCVKQEERRRFPRGAGLPHFIEELVVPYLFGLSHFDDHGKWPWLDYSHGALGIAEYYADADDDPSCESIGATLNLLKADADWREFSKQIRKPSAMRMCVCGSRKPISRCHKGVWAGIAKLNRDIQQLGLDLRRTLKQPLPVEKHKRIWI
jgi:hypothetical protein